MIYLSPNYVVGLVGNENAPILGWKNLIVGYTPSSEDANYPAENLENEATYLKWRAADDADQTIVLSVDNGAGNNLDYVGIAKHNLGTGGATLMLEYFSELDGDDDPIWIELIPEFVVTSDEPILMRFEGVPALGFRLSILDESVTPEIAVIYAGQLLVMPRNIYVGHSPLNINRETEVMSGRSESGHFLGRIVTQSRRSTSASFANLPPFWVRQYLVPFADWAQEHPFFFAWRPSGYPNEVGFSWLTGDVKMQNSLANGFMSAELQMNAVTK